MDCWRQLAADKKLFCSILSDIWNWDKKKLLIVLHFGNLYPHKVWNKSVMR